VHLHMKKLEKDGKVRSLGGESMDERWDPMGARSIGTSREPVWMLIAPLCVIPTTVSA
jgi:hypothetical protein